MVVLTMLALAGSALGAAVNRAVDIDLERRQSGPDISQVWIESFTYGGSGCPSNSVTPNVSKDRQTMTLIFDAYQATLGPGTPVSQHRKNCQLNFGLHYPGGWTYTVLSATYRGYVALDAGVIGRQDTTYYFAGEPVQSSTGTSWVGPLVNPEYQLTDLAQSRSVVYAPCGTPENLNINSQISLTSTNATGTGYISDDSIDTKFVQEFHLQWVPCPSPSPSAAPIAKQQQQQRQQQQEQQQQQQQQQHQQHQ